MEGLSSLRETENKTEKVFHVATRREIIFKTTYNL